MFQVLGTDKEGEHKGVRCHGTRSGQCIFPIYSGHIPVLRTCSDHSNEVLGDSYICYGDSMRYSREEYPHCNVLPNQRFSQISYLKYLNLSSSQMLGLAILPNQSLKPNSVRNYFQVQLLLQIFTLSAKNEIKVLTF
jgi:hypothetical protein